LISRFIAFVKSNRLIVPGDHIFIAVSGGLDSTALLHLFHFANEELDLRLSAVHINHGVRGVESEQDEGFVRRLCGQLNLPLEVRRLSGLTPNSSEETMRRLRYKAFQDILQENPGAKIATGHQLDDQLETVLMRMAKGSYITGLKGIPVKRPGFIRPLLFARRQELQEFLESHGLNYRIDSTNRETDKLRNRVRALLMPALLETFGQGFYKDFAKTIAHFGEIEDFLQTQDRLWLEQWGELSDQMMKFDRQEFAGLPEWRQRRILIYCISLLNPLNSMFSAETFRGIKHFITKAQTGGRFQLPDGIELLADRGKIWLKKRTLQVAADSKELFPDSIVSVKRNKIEIKKVTYKEVVYSDRKEIEYICGDHLKWPLIIRLWRAGDYFFPLGAHGRQKISDYLVNQKINRWQKEQTLVLINGDEVVWLVGHRLDERYAVSGQCKTIYRLRIEKPQGELD